MKIRHGLCLDSLRRIDHQQCSFAGAQAPRHLIREIHMTGRINEIQFIRLAVPGLVKHCDRMRLDGDAAFALQIHRIQQLRLHIARGDGAGAVQQPVRERRLAVVNMGNDAEISYVRCVHPVFLSLNLNPALNPNHNLYPRLFRLREIRAQQDNRKAVEEKEICRAEFSRRECIAARIETPHTAQRPRQISPRT